MVVELERYGQGGLAAGGEVAMRRHLQVSRTLQALHSKTGYWVNLLSMMARLARACRRFAGKPLFTACDPWDSNDGISFRREYKDVQMCTPCWRCRCRLYTIFPCLGRRESVVSL